MLFQGLLLARGIRNNLFACYKLFYIYASYATCSALAGVFFLWRYGLNSAEYSYAYHLPNMLIPCFHLAILLDIRRRVFGNTKLTWRSVLESCILVAAPTAPVAVMIFSSTQMGFFYRYHAVMLFWQMLACVLVYRGVLARREVELGRNLRGILVGVASLVALQAMNFAHVLFAGGAVQVFTFLLQFFYFVALSVFVYSLWSYDPIRVVERSQMERLRHAGESLERTLKVLMTNR
jgi:hypothetical protein